MKNNRRVTRGTLIRGTKDYLLDAEFVAVNIESSAVRPSEGEIIEIGAVIVKNGEVRDHFHTYIKSKEPLKLWISELTGVTDEMLAYAADQKTALTAFREFLGNRPLAVYHGEYTLEFLREGYRQVGINFEPTTVDLLCFVKIWYPELTRHATRYTAEQMGIPLSPNGGTVGGAEVYAKMLTDFFKRYRKMGIHSLLAVKDYEGGRANEQ